MLISIKPIVAISLALGVSVAAPAVANAACAISVGNGEGPTQAIAERRAQRDARAKAGAIRPSNASYSEPMCYVADNFAKGIATYGCEVQYSWCTDPKPPVRDISGPPPGYPVEKSKRHHKHWKHHAGIGHHRSKGHHGGHVRGRIEFGGWGRTRTEIACLRFNARASAPSAAQASSMVNGALIKSISANVGSRFSHANVSAAGPVCSQTGARMVTCTQQARYCY